MQMCFRLSTVNSIEQVCVNSFNSCFSTYKDIFVSGNTKENIWTLNWDYLVDGGNGIGGKIGSSDQTSNYYIDSIPLIKMGNQ